MSEAAAALGRVVATERKPNTPHEFHFWTAIDSPVGIGTIVRVEGAQPIDGQIPRVFGIIVEGFSYTDLQSPMHDVLERFGLDPQLFVQCLVRFLNLARLVQIAEVRAFHIKGYRRNRSLLLRKMGK